MKYRLLAASLAALSLASLTSPAEAGGIHSARKRSHMYPWHGAFYDVTYGAPVALVVPPTAELQTDYGWGVAGTRVSRIDHQFQRPFPGYYFDGYGFLPTPPWPSDTRQFGVYYVRGPW